MIYTPSPSPSPSPSQTTAGGLIKNTEGSALISSSKERKFSTHGPSFKAKETREAANSYTRLSRFDAKPSPFAVVDIECIQSPHGPGHPKPADSTGQIPIAISLA
jgi:hypothetical protein